MTAWIVAGCGSYVAYWLLPDRFKNDLLVLVGIVGLTVYSPLAAAAIAGLVAAVWFALSSDDSRFSLIAIAAIVTAFSIYKLAATGGPFEQPIGLIGIAYAVPRAIHLLIDVRYRGLGRPGFRMLNAYFWFPPLLVVGPIHKLNEFTRGVRRRRMDGQQVALGLERVLVGLVSVKLFADWLVSVRLGAYIDGLDADLTGRASLLRSLEYGLNLYFSFAGWSAVAIGFAATLGFVAPENFSRPFGQPNLAAFWRSWHMTLTRWTNDYVFQPVAAQTRQPQLATVATMVAIALWHEFSGRYLVWALWHAVGLIVYRKFASLKRAGVIPNWFGPQVGRVVGTVLTTTYVFLSFTITRSASVPDAVAEFAAMITGGH